MSTSRRAAKAALLACAAFALPAYATDDLPFGGSHTSKTYFGRGGATGPYGPVQPKMKNPWTATIFGFRCCQTPEEKCARFERQYQIVQAKHAVEMDRLNWKRYNDCRNPQAGCGNGFAGAGDCNSNSRSVWCKSGKCGGCGSCDDGCGSGKCSGASWGLLARGKKGCDGGCDDCGSGCSNAGWKWADGGCGGCADAGCGKCNGGCGVSQVGWFKSRGVCDSGNCGHFGSWKHRGANRQDQFYGDATRNYGLYPGMNREDAVRYLEGMQYYPPYQLIRSPRDFYMFDVKYGVGQ